MRFCLTTHCCRFFLKRVISVNLLIIFVLLPGAWGAERSLANVTAAFIYKISKFVIWPASAFKTKTSTVNLCLYGPDKLGLAAIMDELKGRKTQQRYISIFSLSSEQALDKHLQVRGHCHLLYFTNGNPDQNETIGL